MDEIQILSDEELWNEFYKSNLKIKELIDEYTLNNKKFLIGRVPGCESMICYEYPHKLNNLHIFQLINNAGINVTTIKDIHEYVFSTLKSIQNCTALAVWEKQSPVYKYTGKGQDYLCRISKGEEVFARSLEPFNFLNRSANWGECLKRKNILVISSFCESMKRQIENKKLDKIFGDKTWLEGCKFTFVRPPITLSGNHENKSWLVHFSDFKKRVSEHITSLETKPDVVLVSCGGYGMPICNYIYSELNLSTIYVGGVLQIFFGIIGKRWLNEKEVLHFFEKYREHWIFPSEVEKPSNFNNVERGCYW